MPQLIGPVFSELTSSPIGCVNSHFFDSGSFSLRTKDAGRYAKRTGKEETGFYNTKAFWRYIDGYAAFVRENAKAIDHYANVDAIPYPEITMRNQQYLENVHRLQPVPVFHETEDFRWLREYMSKDYSYLAIGLVRKRTERECQKFLEDVFELVCDTPDRLPKVKLHGFAITGYSQISKFPWYSVDSASWAIIAMYGSICVPSRRDNDFHFDKAPIIIGFTTKGIASGRDFSTLTKMEKEVVGEWIESNGYTVEGVSKSHWDRKCLNLLYFEQMRKTIPNYPWPYYSRVNKRPSLGLGKK